MQKFHDIESGEIITEEQLLKEFNILKSEQPAEYNYTFPEFIMNCLTSNNGTLEKV